jgi:molybdate transport system substrate-binding protein
MSACERSNEKLFPRDVIVPGIRDDQRRDTMHRWILLAATLMACWFAVPVGAAEVLLVSPGAMSSSLTELIPRFEQSSGHKVTVKYSPALALADRIRNGEAADVAILGEPAADELQRSGRLVAGSKAVIAKVGVGVFVPRGAPAPDIGSVEAFLRAVANAQAIAYSDPALGGTAANHVGRLMASLDATGTIRAKTKLTAPSKPLADFVVGGGADFGLTQITEIHADPRLVLAGPLPGPLQSYTHYAASLVAASAQQDIGKALIAFLASPTAAAVMRAKGFEQL